MQNLYTEIYNRPASFRRFECGKTLFTIYNCHLKNRFEPLWSHHNYIIYVVEGKKTWHTPHGSYDLQKGDCVFVRKGAAIVEQFFDAEFCFALFFVPDEFICNVLKTKSKPLQKTGRHYQPVIPIENLPAIQIYFQSMMAYFNHHLEPDQSLLELKFRELILTIADNPINDELRSFFASLLQSPQSVSLTTVMEDNFSFNLKLEEFAKLSARSLSAFKRDFKKEFKATPGKWLVERRLQYAFHLLTNVGRTVSEAAFESGFEDPSHFSRSFRRQYGVSPIAMKLQMIA
jgi:AraC-like DNA-binding protein